MLILSYSERLRVYLHKLSKRVHETTAYRHRTPDCHIIVREFLTGDFGCRIDRCTVLAHSKDSHALRKRHSLDEILGLAACSAVTDGNDLDSVFLNHRRNRLNGFYFLACRRMREDGLIMKEVALLVKTYYLASGPEARVDGKHALLTYRRGKKKLTEILSEYPYGLNISLFLCLFDHLV